MFGPDRYTFTETFEIGPNTGFSSVEPIEGKGMDRRLEFGIGTGIEVSFIPAAFAFQGTRGARLGNFGTKGSATRDDNYPKTDEAYWGDDALHATITVNAHEDGTELPASNNRAYDIWAGAFQQFWVNGPDYDLNGDFSGIERAEVEDIKTFVSIGGSQSRSFAIRDCVVGECFLGFTNQRHGATNGQFGGPIENNSFAAFLGQLFEFGSTSQLGPCKFTCTFAESMWRIGDFTGNTSNEGALVFDATKFTMLHYTGAVPENLIGGNNQGALVFRDLEISGTPVFSAMPGDVRLLDGSRLNSTITPTTDVEKRAWNATLGIFAGRSQHDIKTSIYTATGRTDNVETGEYTYPHVTIPHFVRRAWFSKSSTELTQFRPPFVRPKGNFTGTVTGRVHNLTLSFNPNDRTAWQVGFCTGGTMRCDKTGVVLWIYSRTGANIVAKALNGYDENGDMTVDLLTVGGNFEFIAGGYKSPVKPLWGTLTKGARTITNLRGSTDGLAVGDMLATMNYGFFSEANPIFGEINPDGSFQTTHAPLIDSIGSSITMTRAALLDWENLPLFVWVSPPPTNEVL